MRIFVTGATGFLGSYLIEELLANGHDVAVLVRPGSDMWRISSTHSHTSVILGDLNNLESLLEPLSRFQPDAVAHLGWRGVGNVDRNSPIQTRNIAETANLVTLAADAGATVFVGAGSQAEYGPYDRAIHETDEPHPTTAYGKAKLATALATKQICQDRRLRFAWIRIFSTYGPKDADLWLFPTIIRAARNNQRIPLTLGEQQWGFLHARDAASAFRLVLTTPTAAGVFNLGSPEAPRLRDTIITLRNLTNPSAVLGFGDVPYRSDQVMVLKADVSGLMALGWRPQVDLVDGLRETVEWFVRTNPPN